MAEPFTLPRHREGPLDPPAELRLLRAEQPVSPLAYPDGHQGWLVTSHAAARAVLADQRFSARQELRHFPFEEGVARQRLEPARPGMFIRMDPPDHSRYRRLLTGQFTVRRMRQLEPRIEQIVDEHLDAMERAGSPADLISAYALPIPSMVICELLGVPYDERATFQENSRRFMRLSITKEEAEQAFNAIGAYVLELVHRKRAEPTDDMLSGLVASGELDDEELTNIGIMLLVAGHETTANMLGLGTFTLLTHPEQLALLRNDPDLMENAVEELLRYLSIIQFGTTRAALEDVELEGQRIQAGATVTISLPTANRDPERFDDGERLDVTRPATGHLSFGHGVHQCLGQQLARIEMRIGYAALLERFPALRLAVPPDQVPLKNDMAIYGVHELPVAW